jgi:schlafen family protein
MPLNKPLDEITSADLHALVDNGVSELRAIEYKRDLPGAGDEAKREFLADVTSFANTSGGHLVYGITEESGYPTAVPGVSTPDIEAALLRLESVIRDGVVPRIPGVGLHVIELGNQAFGVVFRVPRSSLRPHMVTFKNLSRFFARTSAGKYQLDVGEIRSAFLAGPLESDRIRLFRGERLAAIAAGELPTVLEEGATVVLHLVPVAAVEDLAAPLGDLSAVIDDDRLRPMYLAQSFGVRWNLDGLFTDDWVDTGAARAYVQVFRSGAIEAVDLWTIEGVDEFMRQGAPPTNGISGYVVERTLIDATKRFLELGQVLGVQPPVVALISLLGVKGKILIAGDEERFAYRRPFSRRPEIDRDRLLLPEVRFELLEADPAIVLRRAFDALWQAGGFPGSPHYDAGGVWQRRGEDL